MSEKNDTKDMARMERAKIRAIFKRDAAVFRIRAIHTQSLHVATKPDEIPKFLVAAADLDRLWTQFESEDDSVLDSLIALGASADYSSELPNQIRELVIASKTIVNRVSPSVSDKPNANAQVVQRSSRLPEIPLPSYGGELIGWPVFRDLYTALIAKRPELSNIERFYYLLGCLTGDALNAIKNIPVSDATYDLAWSTLSERFDKPRQLATVIVEKLLTAPVHTQESVDGLKRFLLLFSDHVSVLESLNIPSLGEFLLFALSSRCLPVSTRKAFEANNKSEFPVLSEIVTYVKTRVSLLEAVACSSLPTRDQPKSPICRVNSKNSKVSLVAAKPETTVLQKCLFCSGNHNSANCSKFIQLSLDERYEAARKVKLCFRCLASTHWSSHCKVVKSFTKCTGRHHSLLHRDVKTSNVSGPDPGTSSTSLLSSKSKTTVLLGTALVHVRDHAGCMQPVRALLDSGSQISAMTTACVDRLGLKLCKWTTPLTGLSGVPIPRVSGVVDCLVMPRHAEDPELHLKTWIMPKIVANMPSQDLPASLKGKFSHLALADPYFDRSTPIDLLLGADVFSRVMNGKRVSINDTLPVAYGSAFGWILIGALSDQDYQSHSSVSLTVSLENLVQRFWHIEEPDEAPASFTCDGQCESTYVSERRRDDSGRFSVPLPFIPKHRNETFPGSRTIAERRFQNLERKLQTNDALYTAYKEFMVEYETLGHMSVASAPGTYFIPHHPVFKSNNPSNKIRVVFDASAKSGSQLSLNQCLYASPKLQLDIVDILVRFRIHQYAFTADVCKMYRQILVLPEYRRFQHILWRPSPLEKVKEYQLNTVTYGVNSAPFLALRVLKDIADHDAKEFPAVQDGLRQQTYVDDICLGADSLDKILTLQSDLCSVLRRAGLELKKWSSNSPSVLEAIPPEDRAVEGPDFENGVGDIVMVLGLQ